MIEECEAQKLKDEYEHQLQMLQDNCPHIETRWLPFMWAPGHFAGRVKSCSRCWKILEKDPQAEVNLKDYENPVVVKP